MKIGFHLNIEQIQKLVMTPELKQAIQILQFNTQELSEFIDDQLLTNPLLDIASPQESEMTKNNPKEEVDWKEYFREYDDISYKQSNYNKDKEEVSIEQYLFHDTTLTEHLMFQLQFSILKKRHYTIGKFIIESLDRNGYLMTPLSEIAALFRESEETVENVLGVIQSFDPFGIAARNLKECLLIQMKQQGIKNEKIFEVVSHHLDDVANNRLAVIAKDLNITTIEVQEIADFIKTLDPKPGSIFSASNDVKYITPDVTVEKIDGEYVVMVNDTSAPRLLINQFYRSMLMNEEKDSSTSKFITDKLNSAMWLVKSIEQRRQTIYKVVKAIVNYQIDFFEGGKKCLRPLTLKLIADEVGVHESTVSRAVNGKYMQSPRGVFELKFFFSSGVSNHEGDGLASESIKSMIQDMIDKENPKKPLSDQLIADLLQNQGINISRRTVAKYRDEMNIQASSKRKRF